MENVIDLNAKVAELEAKLAAQLASKARKSGAKSQKWFEKAQEKFSYLVGLDERQASDPANWHVEVVAVCRCEFCDQEFRRQPCDVHTAQLDGRGCCPACRKTQRKVSAKDQTKSLEAQVAALKAQLAEAAQVVQESQEVVEAVNG